MDHFDVMALMMPDLSQKLRDGFAGIMRQVAHDEREACAHLAEIQAGLERLHFNDENATTAERIARAIRARTALEKR